MRRTIPALGIGLAAALGLGVLGCGGNDGRPVLAQVSGTVTYKGKPLAGASISFLPEQEGIRSALGTTDQQGRYRLWTYDPNDGAPVGKHRVAIALLGPPERVKLHPSVQSKFGEAYYEQIAATGKPLIPEKYLNPMTSGLTAEVVARRHNVFDFEIQGEPPGKTGR